MKLVTARLATTNALVIMVSGVLLLAPEALSKVSTMVISRASIEKSVRAVPMHFNPNRAFSALWVETAPAMFTPSDQNV